MLADKRARLVEQLAEIQDSNDFIDARQRFYDSPIRRNPIRERAYPVRRACKGVRGTGRIEGGGEEIGSTEPFLPPGCKREQRFVVPALGERAMPLEWNQQAHSEALESFSDVGR